MKKILFTLSILLLLCAGLSAQQFVQQPGSPLSATGVSGAILENGGANIHTLIWTTTGSPTGCTIQLENSTLGSSFTLAGAAQTCTSSGSYTLSGTTANFWHVNLATLSGGTAPTVTFLYLGYPPITGNFTDGSFFVLASQCGGSITGTVGTGNATDIVALSGGMRVFRLSNTAAGASNNTFTCVFSVPTRLTTGKGITITDITMLVSTQTTQPTSVVTSTLKTATVPAAVDPETANSSTFVGAGGTITMSPTSAQFAAYTAVAAGQFFSLKAGLATPVLVNTDLQLFVVTFQFNQSAAAAGVQETPGLIVHYNSNPL